MRCDYCDRSHYCKFVEQYKKKTEELKDDDLSCNLFAEKGHLDKLLHKGEEK